MPETKILISWGIFLFLCICGIFLARSIQRSGFLWFLQFLILGPVAAIRLISNTIDMRWYRIVSEDICDYADPDCPIEIKKVAVLDEGRTGRFCRIETNNFTTTDVRNIICKIYLLEDGQKTSDINEYNQFIKSPVKLKKNKTVYEFPFTDDKRVVKAVVRILFIEFENGLRWECKPEHFFHYILNPITDHELRKNGEMYSFPITIGNNVWSGSHVVINPGVTIGDNAVIGAGSVVTKDIPPNVVAAGVPCRVIREINDRDKHYYYKDYKVEPSV